MATLLECMKYAKEHVKMTEEEKKQYSTQPNSKLEKMFFIKHINWERPNDVPIVGYTNCVGAPHFPMPTPTTTYDAFFNEGYVICVVINESVYDKMKLVKTIDHVVQDYFGPKLK